MLPRQRILMTIRTFGRAAEACATISCRSTSPYANPRTPTPEGRKATLDQLQSLSERSADAFKAAIAKGKLFEMGDRLEEILR
jgi:hypothetical protein